MSFFCQGTLANSNPYPCMPRMQVVLVWNAAPGDAAAAVGLRELAAQLWRSWGPHSAAPLLHSVWANLQPSRGNAILSHDWLLLHADEAAPDRYTWQVLPLSI